MTCFYDTATPSAAARVADAQALMTRAQTLWNLPDPLRDEAIARAFDRIAVAREVVAQDPGYRARLAGWLVSPLGIYLLAAGRHDEAVATDPATYGPKLEAAKKLLADLQP